MSPIRSAKNSTPMSHDPVMKMISGVLVGLLFFPIEVAVLVAK